MKVSNEWYTNYLARRAAAAASGASVDRDSRKAQGSELEPVVGDEPVGSPEGKAAHAGRSFISIESRRKRLIDPRANLYGGSKYVEDACMYAGILHDDSEKFSEGIVTQTKVHTDEEEMTVIKVWKLE